MKLSEMYDSVSSLLCVDHCIPPWQQSPGCFGKSKQSTIPSRLFADSGREVQQFSVCLAFTFVFNPFEKTISWDETGSI